MKIAASLTAFMLLAHVMSVLVGGAPSLLGEAEAQVILADQLEDLRDAMVERTRQLTTSLPQ